MIINIHFLPPKNANKNLSPIFGNCLLEEKDISTNLTSMFLSGYSNRNTNMQFSKMKTMRVIGHDDTVPSQM